MSNLLDRVISQLDALVPYLSLAHQEVFDLVELEYENWCQTPDETPMPNTFEAFTTQIAHSAFVLGFSYADAFLADIIREIYTQHPCILSQDKKLSFKSIVDAGDFDSVISRMIDHVLLETMHKGMADVAEYFKCRFDILWPEPELEKTVTASLVRNCIIHNNSIVDDRLAERPSWNVNDSIVLSVSDVHEFGIALRAIVRHIYDEAEARHFSRNPATE